MENDESFFNRIFGSEITNVEFFGTKEFGFNCFIYGENGDIFSSNQNENNYPNIYSAFRSAYENYSSNRKNDN